MASGGEQAAGMRARRRRVGNGFGLGLLSIVCAVLLDSACVGLLQAGFEVACGAGGARGGGSLGRECSGARGWQHGPAWAAMGSARLCLRGGDGNVAQDKEMTRAAGKRFRRPDGELDATHVESLHSVMARADAVKFMQPKVRPSAAAATAVGQARDGGDVVMKVGGAGAADGGEAGGGMGASFSVDGGVRRAANGMGLAPGIAEERGRELSSARGHAGGRRGEGQGGRGCEREGEGGEGDPALGQRGGSPWLLQLKEAAERRVLAQKKVKEKEGPQHGASDTGKDAVDEGAKTAGAAAGEVNNDESGSLGRIEAQEAENLVSVFTGGLLELQHWRNTIHIFVHLCILRCMCEYVHAQ